MDPWRKPVGGGCPAKKGGKLMTALFPGVLVLAVSFRVYGSVWDILWPQRDSLTHTSWDVLMDLKQCLKLELRELVV